MSSNRMSIEALVAKAKLASDEREASGVDEEPTDLEFLAKSRRMDTHLDQMFSKKHRKMTFASFETETEKQAAILAKAETFANAIKIGDAPEGIGFFSPPGLGKTHLGVAILQEIAHPDISVEICAVPKFLAQIRARFSPGSHGDPNEILKRCQNADVLLIDDLGAERETEWAIETLYLLIDHRWNDEKPTIVTSNLSATDFLARAEGKFSKNYGDDPVYSARIYSRLRGMLVGNMHVLDGDDYRARV
jgi:DNA replication protein DnaC